MPDPIAQHEAVKGHEAPPCDNCGHRYGQHTANFVGDPPDKPPSWGGFCSVRADALHTCPCSCYVMPKVTDEERAVFKRGELRRVYDLIGDLREGLSDGPDDAARPASEAGGE